MQSNSKVPETIEEIMLDPHRYGMPTFDEFRKDPDKYRISRDDLLARADNSSTSDLRKFIRKQVYIWDNKHVVDSLEQLERICKEEGFEQHDLDMRPQIIPCSGVDKGKCDVAIVFVPKRKGNLILPYGA